MTKSPTDAAPDRAAGDPDPGGNREIEELRRLLLGSERKRLDHLAERLDNPELRTREISRILPEAIALRTAHDEKIAAALAPTVERSIEASIKKNRRVLVDALFPVMGPAIRKAVASALHSMVQAFDQTLQHSLSFRGLKWRLEAWRTGTPFGEVVLRHTLLYEVEQVFLIHRESSLLLQHVVSRNVKTRDPDLVSSMLSAIRDFVRDSFHLDKDESLDSLQFGSDRTIWVEQGPRALLAAVIRGTPPLELRTTIKETLDAVHLRFGEALEDFNGDPAAFEETRPDLEGCLQSRTKPKEQRSFPVFWIVMGLLVAAAAVSGFLSVRGHRRWAQYLGRVTDEPGILVTSTEKLSGIRHLHGLRDPLAADPAALLKEESLDPNTIAFHFEPFTSTHPRVVLKRIGIALEPPPTVRLDLEGDLLRISGSAPHAWIAKMRAVRKPVPGIERYSELELVDTDARAFDLLRRKVEESAVFFEFGSEDLRPGQEREIQRLSEDLSALVEAAKVLEKTVGFGLIGHADSLGTDQGNLAVSRARAQKVLSLLVQRGLEEGLFTAFGVGSSEPLREEKTSGDRDLNRRVTVRVND